MIKKLATYFIFLFSLFSFSQVYNLTGNLKDVDNNPIAFANVLLVQSDTSAPIEGTTTDDFGDFVINDI